MQLEDVEQIADVWRAERKDRQQRRSLDRAGFEALGRAGLWASVVPRDQGGSWEGMAASARTVCQAFRLLGAAGPSVALVASMHPAVVSFWLASPDASRPEWERQREAVLASAAAGRQWGTITSEPGRGGDISRARATATPTPTPVEAEAPAFLPGRTYAVTGDKHVRSGSGVTDVMMTTAIPDGEDEATIFVLDVRDKPWDGSTGLRLTAEWDGKAWRLPRATPGASKECPLCVWPGTGPSTTSCGRPVRSSRRCSRLWCSACSTRRSPRPGSSCGRGPNGCAPTSRSSGHGRSRSTARRPGLRGRLTGH
ncbi:MAG: hypothetical protein ACRD2W_15565 [Acidimicrobiales bacterium]